MLFEALSVEYGNVTSRVADDARLLQLDRDVGHTFTTHTKQLSQHFMRHFHFI